MCAIHKYKSLFRYTISEPDFSGPDRLNGSFIKKLNCLRSVIRNFDAEN